MLAKAVTLHCKGTGQEGKTARGLFQTPLGSPSWEPREETHPPSLDYFLALVRKSLSSKRPWIRKNQGQVCEKGCTWAPRAGPGKGGQTGVTKRESEIGWAFMPHAGKQSLEKPGPVPTCGSRRGWFTDALSQNKGTWDEFPGGGLVASWVVSQSWEWAEGPSPRKHWSVHLK